MPPAAQQSQPQFPPGVKVPVSEQQQGGLQSQTIGAQRPPSAAAAQLPQQVSQQTVRPNAFPGSLSDLVMSFETVKQKGALPLRF